MSVVSQRCRVPRQCKTRSYSYRASPVQTAHQGPEHQLTQLKQNLLTNVKNSDGVLDMEARKLVKTLDMMFKHTSPERSTEIAPLLQGLFSQLNVTYPDVAYGSSAVLSQLCPYLTYHKDIQVKLLSTTVAFGCDAPQKYSRRDLVEFLDLGLKGYLYQPGQYNLMNDRALSIQTRGFYLVPASSKVEDIRSWSTYILDAKIGLDDMGNAGIVTNRQGDFTVSYADDDTVVLESGSAPTAVLERISKS